MKKAIIIIDPNCHYHESHKGGAKFTSVSMNGKDYGSASPCDNDEEIDRAFHSACKWVLREGQQFEVRDLRPKKPMFVTSLTDKPEKMNINPYKTQQTLF